MKKGEIVLIPFPFTDLTGNKLRPALILHESASDIIVSFITTQIQGKEKNDIILNPDNKTGIKKTSLVRLSKLATLDKDLVIGKIGSLNKSKLKEVDDKLIVIFNINFTN